MRLLAWVCAALSVHSWLNGRLLRVPPLPDDLRPFRDSPRSTFPESSERSKIVFGEGRPRATVSVLLPVRDEAADVSACLRSVLAQTHPCEVLVLDDGSTDGTANLVRELGLEPLTGAALPPGWLGKAYACQQLADTATGDVLVFVDADVVLAPHAVAATVALLEETDLDLVSPYPRQLASGRARLVQPLLQWSWLTFLPLRLAEQPGRPSLSAANGQLLAVRRTAYDRAGGHAAVRADVVEDVGLLRAVKRVGGRGGVVDGTGLATCRMYGTWAELSQGYRKSLHTVPAPVLALLAGLYLLPPLAALRGSRAGAAATVAAVAGRVVTARRTGARSVDAVAHPASIAALLWLAARARVDDRRGARVWKGRLL